jgi:hypothetical protein
MAVQYNWDEVELKAGVVDRMEKIMDDLDITRKELAYMLKLPKSTIDNWFDKRTITLVNVVKFCDKFHVSGTFILLGLGCKYFAIRKDKTFAINDNSELMKGLTSIPQSQRINPTSRNF